MLEELRRDPGRSGLDVVLVNVWEGVEPAREAKSFCAIWGIPEHKVLVDERGEYARALQIPGVPTNVLVDGEGIVRAVGVSRRRELYRAVDELLERARQDSSL
jgi:hypothetical protein